eukprot:TRINITY_DN55221_c0_g1_i1.p1 TRINITY_DN55221_c0_g1~~TRINITY_DN55221_c0_g1_i1.p1  ORF type:complete len:549 (+),score=117.50 TRINITY_DN55221_c0_g1_i1:86-1732(+)
MAAVGGMLPLPPGARLGDAVRRARPDVRAAPSDAPKWQGGAPAGAQAAAAAAAGKSGEPAAARAVPRAGALLPGVPALRGDEWGVVVECDHGDTPGEYRCRVWGPRGTSYWYTAADLLALTAPSARVLPPGRPVVAVLSCQPQLYSTRRVVDELAKLGARPLVLNTRILHDDIRTGVFRDGYDTVSALHTVLPRRSNATARVAALFEQAGCFVANTTQAIETSRDKLAAWRVLAEYEVPQPATAQIMCSSGAAGPLLRQEVLRCVAAVSRESGRPPYPVVVKGAQGTQGAAVRLAKDEAQAVKAGEELLADGEVLVQEFIEESKGIDVRVFCVGGQVAAAMRRRAASAGEFRSNFHLGGHIEPIELTGAHAAVALAASKALGLEISGVDLLEGAKGPVVCEVNASPGMEGIEKANAGVSVAGIVAAHCCRMAVERGATLATAVSYYQGDWDELKRDRELEDAEGLPDAGGEDDDPDWFWDSVAYGDDGGEGGDDDDDDDYGACGADDTTDAGGTEDPADAAATGGDGSDDNVDGDLGSGLDGSDSDSG